MTLRGGPPSLLPPIVLEKRDWLERPPQIIVKMNLTENGTTLCIWDHFLPFLYIYIYIKKVKSGCQNMLKNRPDLRVRKKSDSYNVNMLQIILKLVNWR